MHRHLIRWGLLGCLIIPGLAASALAQSPHPGLRTGGGHLVIVTTSPTEGLEVGIPQKSWYAKGIAFDLETHWGKSHIAYTKAVEEFEKQLKNRPQWAKMIRGWLLKAKFMRHQSRQLNYRNYSWSPPSASTLYNRGSAKHNKWLAIRAFTGRESARLRIQIIEAYEGALRRRPDYDQARIALAALHHEIGQHAKGRLIFSQAKKPEQRWHAMASAYYFTTTGNWDKAFALIKKSIRYNSRNKSVILKSNQFDRLRTDRRFKKLIGEP